MSATSSAKPVPVESGVDLLRSGSGSVSGTLHVYVAFDWGEEIDVERARALVPSEVHDLPRRRRTPSSIGYRPLPLRVTLPAVNLELTKLGIVQAPAEATVFDFAAVSLAIHVPFTVPAEALTEVAGSLADPTWLVKLARQILHPLHQQLLPSINDPIWQDDLSEEYFVFQLHPTGTLPTPDYFLTDLAGWLAGLVRLEPEALSKEEVSEALRLSIRYSPNDLYVADWAAAFLLDHDCDETLQTIEFANLQLLFDKRHYLHILF